MPRFQIHAEFDLTTEIEPEFSRYAWDSSDVEEFDDDSYFQTSQVASSGGSLRFIVEAESEEDAEEKANEVISEGSEAEDGNGFTWLVESLVFNVEEIEEPMTLERAEAILIGLAEGQSDPKVKEAVEFVFDRLGTLETRLSEATQRIDALVTRVQEAEAATQAATS